MAAVKMDRQQQGVGRAIDQVARTIDKVELWAAALTALAAEVPRYDFRRMNTANWKPVPVRIGRQTRIGIRT